MIKKTVETPNHHLVSHTVCVNHFLEALLYYNILVQKND